MTTSQQITKFLVDAIAYHEDRAMRFRKTLDAFHETGSTTGGMVINCDKPSARAPKGSRLETIKAYLEGGLSQCIIGISDSLNIPRSSVSTVLHKHSRTFKHDKRDNRWSLRQFTLASK